jgi:glycosyltransferase involved in cell wall biosynthesis
MTDLERIEVAMPTYNSADVLAGTLDTLADSESASAVEIARLVLVDNESTDGTPVIARKKANQAGWDLTVVSKQCSLSRAREMAIAEIDTEWFLFLDDDVRVHEMYLTDLTNAAAPLVGGVQGRKRSRSEPPSKWVRRRARRGGTHATLIRRAAIEGVSIPSDLNILEDEYIRRHVEKGGFLWVFNHQARFRHANQDRHPIGWEEGFLAGKYDLKPFYEVALNVPFSVVRRRNPLPHIKRSAGWLAGYLRRPA